jgi:hypothetical protein
MSRLHAIPSGAGVLLVPDYCNPYHSSQGRDERIVRPAPSRKEGRRARI